MSHVSAGDARNKIRNLYFFGLCNDLKGLMSSSRARLVKLAPSPLGPAKLAGQFATGHHPRMASAGQSRRWIVVGLVALGIVVAATWSRRGSDDAAEEQGSEPSGAWAAPEYKALPSTANRHGSDGGVASRRIADDCDPVAESLKYEEFIGTRARAILSWNEMSPAMAGLKIPVDVMGIEDGAVGVRFHHLPMSQQFITAWLHSGHIRRAPEGLFELDPCSATIVAWSEKNEDMAENEEEDEEIWLDEGDELGGDELEAKQPKPGWPLNITIPSEQELEGPNAIGNEE